MMPAPPTQPKKWKPFHWVLLCFTPILAFTAWWWYLHSAWPFFICFFVLFTICFFGVTQMQWNFFTESLNHGSKNKKSIALTFDDGFNKHTAALVEKLNELQVPATFFMIGKNMVGHEAAIKKMHEQGHAIGNHSYSHGFNFDWQSVAKMKADFMQCNALIESIVGSAPLLLRVPYGIMNPNVAKAVEQLNMYSIGWNVRSFDTLFKNKEKLLNRLLQRIKPGAIILMHDSEQVTLDILTDFIQAARKQGYTFERVDQLLGLQAYA